MGAARRTTLDGLLRAVALVIVVLVCPSVLDGLVGAEGCSGPLAPVGEGLGVEATHVAVSDGL